MNTLISKHQFSIFKNIEDVKIYLKTYINQLLNAKLDNISKYSKKEVYEKCFLPIAKNVDIYSLSLVMFHMFYNNFYQQSFSPKDKDFTLSNLVTDKTLELISKLFEDALYNKIKDPIDLAERLDNIIKKIE
jgi:capsule polysaccharide modification protein KpsS